MTQRRRPRPSCVGLGRRQRDGRAAALLGVAVGVLDAAIAALFKAITDIAARDPVHTLSSWQLYIVGVLGAAVLLLNQLAYQAGPISASLPAIATINPLLRIAVGVLVYDEHLAAGPVGGTVLIVLLMVLCVAIVQLARTSDQAATPAPAPRAIADHPH